MATRPDTEYSERRKSGSHPTLDVNARLDRLERERISDPPSPPTNEDKQLSIAMSKRMVRLRIGYGLLATIGAALGVGATNLISYARGLGDDHEEREAALSEVRAVRDQLDGHEAAMVTMVSNYRASIDRTDDALRTMAQVQLLQWAYVTQVVEATRLRKTIPAKPPALVEAEAKAAVAIRDKP